MSLFRTLFILTISICSTSLYSTAQSIPTPTILEVKEDDRAATIYWNSKTNTYSAAYDPDKQQGIFSYLIEWGKVSEGYTEREVTPYRVFMAQPLEPDVMYQARVYALDAYGNKSAASTSVEFQHSDVKVTTMQNELNGFFDDFNLPMGAFDETKWNQSYSGCAKIGYVSQHINNQYHGHNAIASDECDRGVASSRVREHFDFTNRTGVIEFDLDGSKLGRNFWYLDLSPATRKRDLTGHTALEVNGTPPQSDPAYLLRFVEFGSNIDLKLADENGNLHTLDNLYQNGACGNLLEFCNGENLLPVPNVRRHWRIELSKTAVKVFINDILIIDGSLITAHTPSGLPYEVAQVNWLFFSYNTPKENAPLTMIHWDNFGFDAPDGYTPSNVIHNYTDGLLGTATAPVGNEKSAGGIATLSTPYVSAIPIPDSIEDTEEEMPIEAELMFTMQGGTYDWTVSDYIDINGNSYPFAEPASEIPSFPSNALIETNKPHSVILDIDPAHLITGNNQIQFYLNDARLLNIHIELTYPIDDAPSYTPPKDIHSNYMQTLMNFHTYAAVGPGIVFNKVDGSLSWESEFSEEIDSQGAVVKIVKHSPVSGTILLDIFGNSNARLAATGHAVGISYYEIWVDQQVIQTIHVDNEEAIAAFQHIDVPLNTLLFTNGVHELFVQAYDKDGNLSVFDWFLSNVQHGEYIPMEINVQNEESCPTTLEDIDLGNGNPYSIPAHSYQSSNNITSTGVVVAATSVVFDVGGSIILESGFTVEEGAVFTAMIGGCMSSPPMSSNAAQKTTENDVLPSKSINIYPNPTTGQLFLDIQADKGANIEIQLYDLSGKKLVDFEPPIHSNEPHQIDVSDLQNGTYLMRIVVGEEINVKKLAVSK